jgi:CRISPR system Cascade subunit CasD
MNRRFLLFQLYGPLASWGSIAVGDMRPTFDRPSKSAVLGLIGASLGLKRPHREMGEEQRKALEEKHRALAASFGYAVRVDNFGVFLSDYHTVQTPSKEAEWVVSRRDEVRLFDDQVRTESKKPNAIVSHREYYSDMLATVCLWGLSDAAYSLNRIRSALEEPTFTPYLGRKACPPALPFYPELVEAATIREAFANASMLQKLPKLNASEMLLKDDKATYYWEGSRDQEGFKNPQQVTRRDQPESRSRWQFSTRIEYMKRSPRDNSSK